MKSEWVVQYGNSEIKVVNTWFSGESLFVNNELQDKKYGLVAADLSGHVLDENGEKKAIKVHLGGLLQVNCLIFIDDKKVTPTKVR